MGRHAMASATPLDDSVSELAMQSDAIGRLAQDGGAFAAAVAAFESRDPAALRWVLQRLELLPQCELICEWIQIKLCALRCFEVCGPPREGVSLPDLPQFVRAIVQLSANETLLRRVVDAVACGNREDYRPPSPCSSSSNFAISCVAGCARSSTGGSARSCVRPCVFCRRSQWPKSAPRQGCWHASLLTRKPLSRSPRPRPRSNASPYGRRSTGPALPSTA